MYRFNLFPLGFLILSQLNLNTTHVSVQFYYHVEYVGYDDNLNTTHVSVQSFIIFLNIPKLFYLNTTHVSVQLFCFGFITL